MSLNYKLQEAAAEIIRLAEQLRLANIDQLNTEAELAEAKTQIAIIEGDRDVALRERDEARVDRKAYMQMWATAERRSIEREAGNG